MLRLLDSILYFAVYLPLVRLEDRLRAYAEGEE